MIVPSIDLQNGKAVQLRQGRDHVLTEERDPMDLAREFNRYGEVAVIDLDAAMGTGDNLDLIRKICRVADVRAGGGIRDVDRGRTLLRAGARKIIIGTAATPELLAEFPKDRVIVALDHRDGIVSDHGWKEDTGETVDDRAVRLAPYCDGFLVTNIVDEGGMGGVDLETIVQLRKSLPRAVTVAGGIRDGDEVAAISRAGLDVQVGMALYTSNLDPVECVIKSIDFDKCPLVPTVVQDTAGQVLMLAYSNQESLGRALREGKGIFYSRSRNEIWEKGLTSGHTQELISCRTDCDRDTLLFIVRQTGVACHTGDYSCFGNRKFSLQRLFEVLKQRKADMPEGSLSVKMFRNRALLKDKIFEEAREVVDAATQDDIVWEIADVLYFMSLLAADESIEWQDIEAELGGRHK